MSQLVFGLDVRLGASSAGSGTVLLAVLAVLQLVWLAGALAHLVFVAARHKLDDDAGDNKRRNARDRRKASLRAEARKSLLAASALGLLGVSCVRLAMAPHAGWTTVIDAGILAGSLFTLVEDAFHVRMSGLAPGVDSASRSLDIRTSRFIQGFTTGMLALTSLSAHVLPLAVTKGRHLTPATKVGLAEAAVACATLVCFLITPPRPVRAEKEMPRSAVQDASPLSRMLFLFLERGMVSYYIKPGTEPFAKRVPPLPQSIASSTVLRRFQWTSHKDGDPANGWQGGVWAFANAYRTTVAKIWVAATIWIIATFLSPLSMNLLLRYVQEGKTVGDVSPYLFVTGLFIAPAASSAAYQQALFCIFELALRLRVALGHAVFSKVMRTREGGSDGSEGGDTVGRVNNLVGTDIDVITSSLESFVQLYGVPPKLVIALVGLWLLLGWPAFVALGIIIAFMPLSFVVSSRYGGAQEQIMKATDSRVTLVSEILSSIRTIKIYGWERAFMDRIATIRNTELDRIIGRAKVFGGMMLLSTGVPAAVTLATFAAYTYGKHEPLTASTAFTSITLFGLLREAVISSTYLSSAFMRARVSLKRIQGFLQDSEELDDVELPTERTAPEAIELRDAKFQWSRWSKPSDFTLDISRLDIPIGKTTVIVGSVGSGKSALLYALLGEMHRRQGSCTLHPIKHSISYAAQSPYLQNASIRDNILMNEAFDQARYDKVIEACSLSTDLANFENGDDTVVGEKGMGLSGGQAQRVNLARAVYARTPVVLLDDVLSAVDSETLSRLVERCLNGSLLRGRTVVLVTHYVELCTTKIKSCSLVVHMDDGKIAERGRPSVLQHHRRTSSVPSVKRDTDDKKDDEKAPADDDGGEDDAEENEKIPWSVYFGYFRSLGGPAFWAVYIVINLVAHLLMLAQGAWVGQWVNAPDHGERLGFYYGIYALIQVSGGVTLTAMYLMMLWGAVQASRVLHRDLASAIFNAPVRWFDATPFGRILNRFTKDMETVDTEIVESLQPVLDYTPQVLLVAIIITVVLPIFLGPAVVIGLAFYGIGRLYLFNALATRKHVAAARSPLFSTLSDTASGIVVIRAYGAQRRFIDRYLRQTDTYNKMQFYESLLDRWLEERSDICGALVALIVGMLSLRGGISSGTTGFLVSTGLEFTNRILYVIRSINRNELSLNSAHRVIKYTHIEQEPANDAHHKPAAVWPSKGEIIFDNFSARYAADAPDILRRLSFTLRPGQKIGIVGESGGGKSSLALCLLRFPVKSSGTITIDGKDIEEVNLEDLRQRVTLIPQDPVLFSGTLRSNLDPFNEHDDESIWSTIHDNGFVREPANEGDEDGEGRRSMSESSGSKWSLESHVASGGSNLSQGQRQTLSLARAMLRRSKVVILDEATASVDAEMDKMVQSVVRREFSDSTVITIAHRLESIMDYDRVLVMQRGQLAEDGAPFELLKTGEHFKRMVKATGHFDRMLKTAEDAHNSRMR